MKKNFLYILFFSFCLAKDASVIENKRYIGNNSPVSNLSVVTIQIGHIYDFILDLGHPFKKQSQFGYAIIQQGKLNEFVLDQGYPSKIKPSSTISNFKIIGEY
ncbi:MAG: hypothetical protein VXA50_05060 [bacterium]